MTGDEIVAEAKATGVDESWVPFLEDAANHWDSKDRRNGQASQSMHGKIVGLFNFTGRDPVSCCATICHEAVHMAQMIMRHRGVNWGADHEGSDETEAYLVDWFFREILERL